MAQSVTIELKNFKSLEKFFDRYPPEVTTRAVAQRAMKKAAKPLVNRIRANAPIGLTGSLKKSIGTTVSKRRSGPIGQNVVAVGPRRSKTLRGFTGTFIESGTDERTQKKTGKGVGRIQSRPFVEPAFNSTVGIVQKNLGRELAIAVVKEARKQANRLGTNR